MILAIDVGNTNSVLGCVEDGKVINTVRIQTRTGETTAEHVVKLKQILDVYGIDPRGFEGAILSSVVPPVTNAFTGAVRLITGLECMTVGPGLKTGMNVRIDDPGTLGPDLVVGGVAAMHYYGKPVIVADLGTATTITLVDADGSFRGGAIMPGVKLSYRALASGTSLLPDISITPPKKVIATNTVDCMRSGAVFGTAAILDGMIDRMEQELGEDCRLVATGGIAKYIAPFCRRQIIVDDDLLLKGLWVLWERNRK